MATSKPRPAKSLGAERTTAETADFPDVPGTDDADSLTLELGPQDESLQEDGSMIILLGDEEDDAMSDAEGFEANLAEVLDDSVLTGLVTQALEDIDDDSRSREDWEKTYKDGLKLLGLKYEDRTEPWNGACGVHHPMITEAVVRFQSETMMETFPAGGPVLTKVVGKETRQKMEAAQRVRADMNYQLTERMVEFRDEHDRMLFNLPAVGCAFKKVYRDPSLRRNVSVYVGAEDVLLPYGATNARSAPRVSHRLRYTKNDLLRLQQSGFYRKCELGSPAVMQNDIEDAKDKQAGVSDINDDRYTVYEMLVNLEIDDPEVGDVGFAVPYVLTICRDTQTVLALRRNWEEGDETFTRRQHFVQYDYIPGIGAYGLGLFHIIGGYAKAATSITRQLVDAGTLSNLPGGLKSKGMRVKGDDTPIRPGEFRDVDVGSGKVQDNIMPLPYKEPSAVLHALLKDLIEDGRRIPGMVDLKVSDMSAQAPVGTILALIERQLKVMSAVQARVHKSLKEELVIIKQLVVDHEGDEHYDYEPQTGSSASRAADYAMVEVIPVSDPNAATMTQRLVQYQAVIQLSQTAPQIYDLPLLHRGMLDVLGIKNAEKLVPIEDDIHPMDPVTENMRVLKGEPIKAFVHQDHEAHLAAHQAAMQDPMLMQIIGQNPQAQQMMGAAMAHIAEHAAFMYRAKIEQELGITLPPEDAKLPPEVETALSGLMARAGQRVLAENQQKAAQAQAQQQMQDPVLQLQIREQDRKDRETALKEKIAAAKIAGDADAQRLAEAELAADVAAKADKQALEEAKLRQSGELGEQKIQVDAMRVGSLSRAQDIQQRQHDQEMAMRIMERLQQAHEGNGIGED